MTSKTHGLISHLCALITTCLHFFSSFSLSPTCSLPFVLHQIRKHKSSSAAVLWLEGNGFLFPAVEMSITHGFSAGHGPSQSLSQDVVNFFTEVWFVSRRGRITYLHSCFPYIFFLLYKKLKLIKWQKGCLQHSCSSSALAVWPPAGRVSEGDRASTTALWQRCWCWGWASAASL